MNVLVTGCAGFIGYHLSNKLSDIYPKKKIFGIDNLNNYYDVKLKKDRLNILKNNNNFKFEKIDICNKKKLISFVKKNKIKIIINLAAQAGVRHSITHPEQYYNYNIKGFFNILEICKETKIKHLITASTSSVYGKNNTYPTHESCISDNPESFYAASKKCNEVLGYSYSKIYNIRITNLRFFTVYGPYGRPDMALYKFITNIKKNKSITLFNNGNHERDFTYIDDVVYSIIKIINHPFGKEKYNIINISGSRTTKLKEFVKIIEKKLNIVAKKKYTKMQMGDVYKNYADNSMLKKIIGKYKFTNIEKGIEEFILWYNNYHTNRN